AVEKYRTLKPAFYEHIPLFMSLMFYVPRPQSHTNKRGQPTKAWRAYPTSKPDLSNYIKGIEDALNGIAYHDDAQIVSESPHKRYADGIEPCVRIQIREVKGGIAIDAV
ncbi:MAG: RusA family crossover junction endodeoxyribonuclease, partial [Nitrospirae bacterium]|nr:RusA family crossover junction endodeoxyribonuclease [Nitrospirota bacterium]